MASKWIICDGDQTIYRNVKTPVEEGMLGTLKNLIDSKFEFCAVSGTDVKEIARLIRSKDLGKMHHILANSGSAYYIYSKGELKKVYEFELATEKKKNIISALDSLIEEFRIHPLTSREDQIQDRRSQITFSALGRNAPIDAKNSYDPDKRKRKKHVKYLREYLPEDEYAINIGGTTSIDITIAGIDKAFGIRKLLEYNPEMKLTDITFFGDKLMKGGNDYSVKSLKGVKCVSVKGVEDCQKRLEQLLHRS